MKILKLIILLQICFFALVFTSKQSKQKYNKHQQRHLVKQQFLSDRNYTKILKQYLAYSQTNSLIGILFTNKNCQTCQTFQPQILGIIEDFQKQNILVFRCQLDSSIKLAQRFNVKRFPMMHFAYKKIQNRQKKQVEIQLYKTTQILTKKALQIAKYLKSVIEYQLIGKYEDNLLETLQQIPQTNKIIVNMDQVTATYGINKQRFLQQIVLNELFNSMPVIALSKQEFDLYMIEKDLEFPLLRGQYQQPFILVEVQSQKQSNFEYKFIQNDYFEKIQENGENLLFLFQSLLLSAVQQFNENIYKVYQQYSAIINPANIIYLAIVDSIWKRQQSERKIYILNGILKNFQGEISIFWTQGQINSEKKVLLGFQKQSIPPLFGKLILNKSLKKQPLKDRKTNLPIFSQSKIKQKIRSDLGYQTLLAQKIKYLLESAQLSNTIKVSSSIIFQNKSSQLKFAYCASQKLKLQQINKLAYLITRAKRFYPLSSLQIFTNPCMIDNKQTEDGLYLIFRNKYFLISKQIKSCLDIQNQIRQITVSFSKQLKRIKLFPKYFCVSENQMKQFLISMS